VAGVNAPPTPARFRVLCSLDAPWPQDFHPLAHPDFEVLHSFVPLGVPDPASANVTGGRVRTAVLYACHSGPGRRLSVSVRVTPGRWNPLTSLGNR
jgi:hypothetical protein